MIIFFTDNYDYATSISSFEEYSILIFDSYKNTQSKAKCSQVFSAIRATSPSCSNIENKNIKKVLDVVALAFDGTIYTCIINKKLCNLTEDEISNYCTKAINEWGNSGRANGFIYNQKVNT